MLASSSTSAIQLQRSCESPAVRFERKSGARKFLGTIGGSLLRIRIVVQQWSTTSSPIFPRADAHHDMSAALVKDWLENNEISSSDIAAIESSGLLSTEGLFQEVTDTALNELLKVRHHTRLSARTDAIPWG